MIEVDVGDPGQVGSSFERLIAAILDHGGFEVLPSDQYAVIWKRETASEAPLVDPSTGVRDEDRYKRARARALREAGEILHANAVLFATIEPTTAHWTQGTAKWDGTQQQIQTTDKIAATTVGGLTTFGEVGALSLYVTVVDVGGTEIYANVGGVQVRSLMSGYLTFAPIPANDLLRDVKRNTKAVLIATDGLRGPASPVAHACMAERYRAMVSRLSGRKIPKDPSAQLPDDFLLSDEGKGARVDCDLAEIINAQRAPQATSTVKQD